MAHALGMSAQQRPAAAFRRAAFARRPARPLAASRAPVVARIDKNKLDQLSTAENELSKMALWDKIAFAMRIFFPPREDKSARQEAKKRLRMILVADRCTLPVSSLTTMKTEIVKAVSQFVEVEGEETVDVNLTRDESLGTVYSVSIPIRRVRPQYDENEFALPDGMSYEVVEESGPQL